MTVDRRPKSPDSMLDRQGTWDCAFAGYIDLQLTPVLKSVGNNRIMK